MKGKCQFSKKECGSLRTLMQKQGALSFVVLLETKVRAAGEQSDCFEFEMSKGEAGFIRKELAIAKKENVECGKYDENELDALIQKWEAYYQLIGHDA